MAPSEEIRENNQETSLKVEMQEVRLHNSEERDAVEEAKHWRPSIDNERGLGVLDPETQILLPPCTVSRLRK